MNARLFALAGAGAGGLLLALWALRAPGESAQAEAAGSSVVPRVTPAPVAAAARAPHFWEAAVVPEPTRPRLPRPAVAPPPAGRTSAEASAHRVRELAAQPDSPERRRALHDAIVLWFAQAPEAAAAWLGESPEIDLHAPAIASIAESMAARGHVETALQWLETVRDPRVRNDALIAIYNLEARHGRVTREAAAAAGFTPAEIDRIFLAD